MRRRFVGVALAVGMLALLAWPSRHACAQASDDAEKLIRHGVELRKAHDDEGAARAFQRAYDKAHSPRAAGQLGLAEQALGRWEDAERHVGEALHATGDPWVTKNRAALDEALVTIQVHLGRVEVLGDPEGAEVSVNGHSVGKLPLADAVRVSAGQVDVEMRAPGYVPVQRTLTIIGGQYQRLVLHLVKEELALKPPGGDGGLAGGGSIGGGGGGGDLDRPAPPPSRARKALKWSAAGAAGVGLAVGITATILHNNNVSKFDAYSPLCADNNGKAVHQLDGSAAPECQGALDAYRRDTTFAVVGFVGAGAFAVTWLVLQLTEGPSHRRAIDHAMVQPLCAPSLSGLGLSCEARF
jgi:hypothetical protein